MFNKWFLALMGACIVSLSMMPVYAGQDDYVIPNSSGQVFRLKVQSSLQASQTLNSGATEPAVKYPYQLWMDTSTNTLKQRNSSNTAWNKLYDTISPLTTQGDMLYHDGTNNARLPKGTAGQVLTVNAGATAPEWASSTSGAGSQVTSMAWQNARNLKAIYTNTTTVTVTVDEVLLQETTTFASKRFANVSEVIAITTSGAGGLDTGSEAASTWYHIWLIGKTDGTIDGLLSTSTTAPTMPSGYTYKSYVGAVYNNGSSNFTAFTQVGNKVQYDLVLVLSTGSQTATTAVSLATAVPATARGYSGMITSYSSGKMYYLYSTTSGYGYLKWIDNYQHAASNCDMLFENFPISVPQTTYYSVSAGAYMDIYVTGYIL